MDFIGIESSKTILQERLRPERYAHSLRVARAARALAARYGLCESTLEIAGLLHDCSKHLEALYLPAYESEVASFIAYPSVLHAPLGAFVARDEYGAQGEVIFNGIYYHCTGRPGMTIAEACLFVADGIEEGRTYPGVEKVRQETEKSLWAGVLAMLACTMGFLEAGNEAVCPLTGQAYEYYKKELAD